MYLLATIGFLAWRVRNMAAKKELPAKEPSETSLLIPFLNKAASNSSSCFCITGDVFVRGFSNRQNRIWQMSFEISGFFPRQAVSNFKII